MQDSQAKSGNGWRRGGGSSVTPLFVAAFLLAGAVFALTEAFISPADVIAPFVPANAVAYLHASGRTATDAVLSSSVQMPSGVAPDEVAVFAAPGDDALRWGVILAWRAPKSPTAADVAALEARGATRLDPRRFIIGDDALAIASRVAAAAHASLADDPTRRDALDLMRSVSSIQAYALPSALLAPETAAALAEFAPDAASPLVVGVNLGRESVHARVMTVNAAASRASWLGYRESPGRGKPFDADRFPAQTALTEEAPSFDLAKLFSDVPRAKNHPMPSLLTSAGDALRVSLARPYALWLRPDKESGRIDYVLRIDGASPTDVRRTLARYAATINPDRAVLRLPDGDSAIEFRLDDAARAEKMGTTDAAVALDGGTGGAIAIGSDGENGTLLASSTGLIAEYRAGKESRPDAAKGGCPDDGFRAAIDLKEPATTLSAIPQAASVIRLLNLKSIRISLTVDEEIAICGYK